ncbi:MAG: hypothetical protein H0X43_07595 [Nitrosospira sp.]|nr:hypothetical protein [Nitrosospira sp.]
MEKDDDKVLWSDLARSRYFLIPREHSMPIGDFIIRGGLSRQKQIELDAIIRFEIAGEEAKAWLDSQFEHVLEKAKSGFLDSLKQTLEGKPAAAKSKESVDPAATSAQRLRESNEIEAALSLFSALVHEPAVSLRSDPEVVIRGMQKIGADITAILSNATSQSPEDLQAARTQFKSILETLREHGLSVSNQADTLPDRLHDLSKSFRHSRKQNDGE